MYVRPANRLILEYVGRSNGFALEKCETRAFSFPIFIAGVELENLDRQLLPAVHRAFLSSIIFLFIWPSIFLPLLAQTSAPVLVSS